MQAITVLVAIFVLSFIAGFGWQSGSRASRVMTRMLRREVPKTQLKNGAEVKRVEPTQPNPHKADQPAS